MMDNNSDKNNSNIKHNLDAVTMQALSYLLQNDLDTFIKYVAVGTHHDVTDNTNKNTG
jgi:hypothetical protein